MMMSRSLEALFQKKLSCLGVFYEFFLSALFENVLFRLVCNLLLVKLMLKLEILKQNIEEHSIMPRELPCHASTLL